MKICFLIKIFGLNFLIDLTQLHLPTIFLKSGCFVETYLKILSLISLEWRWMEHWYLLNPGLHHRYKIFHRIRGVFSLRVSTCVRQNCLFMQICDMAGLPMYWVPRNNFISNPSHGLYNVYILLRGTTLSFLILFLALQILTFTKGNTI